MHLPLRAPSAPAQAPKGADGVPARIARRLSLPAAGTQRWLQRFGNALVTVYYRDDLASGRRADTVELLVDERALPVARAKAQAHEEVLVQIRYRERSMAAQARLLAATGIPMPVAGACLEAMPCWRVWPTALSFRNSHRLTSISHPKCRSVDIHGSTYIATYRYSC